MMEQGKALTVCQAEIRRPASENENVLLVFSAVIERAAFFVENFFVNNFRRLDSAGVLLSWF
jgi:hypothetical protein